MIGNKFGLEIEIFETLLCISDADLKFVEKIENGNRKPVSEIGKFWIKIYKKLKFHSDFYS